MGQFDVTMDFPEEKRPPCPECEQPSASIVYRGARVQNPSVVQSVGGGTMAAISIIGTRTALFMPCRHEFDGVTGAKIREV